MKIVVFGLALVSLVSVSFASVDLPGFGEYQDGLATYAYTQCEKIKDWSDSGTYYRGGIARKADYTCEGFVLTMNAENGGWNINAQNRNNNGTFDKGLCQLNSAYHSKFINSDDFKDPYKQVDYCLGVWADVANRNKMPRYAHDVRFKRDKGIIFNPPLDQEIVEKPHVSEIVETPTYPKPGCRRVGNVEANEYIQVDTRLGQLRQMIFPKQKSKLFICSE